MPRKRHTLEEIVAKLRQVDVLVSQGVPIAHAVRQIRRCYGPEFVARTARDWIAAVGAKTAYIEPGSPWENGYVESFMYGRPLHCKA